MSSSQVKNIDAEFKAAELKSKKQCPVRWSDILNDKYPCPSLDEWPEWWDLQNELGESYLAEELIDNKDETIPCNGQIY